jgi:hypothetical protein
MSGESTTPDLVERVRVIDEARAAAARLAESRGYAMSQQGVKLMREAIDAWNQREADLRLSYAAPEIEWIPAGPAAVERAVYRGYDEVASAGSSASKPFSPGRSPRGGGSAVVTG